MNQINIYAIAKEAGVSTATVSRVVSDHPSVKPETRAKVQAIVEKYNYRPNQIATGLLKKSQNTLCLLLPSMINTFYAALCTNAQRNAEACGYKTQIITHGYDSPWSQVIIDEIIGRRADGVVIVADIAPHNIETATRALTQLQRYMPVVIIAIDTVDESAQCPCLALDLAGSMRNAVRHLHTLGHRRIAMLGGNPVARYVNSREAAYNSIIEELELESYACPFPSNSCADGESAVLRLFSAYEKSKKPTALVAFNDLTALGALKQLKRMGYGVPRDVALIGCDNQFFTPYLDPALTTTELHIDSVVESAIHLLTQAYGQPIKPFRQTYDSTLIIRESCGAAYGYRVFQ